LLADWQGISAKAAGSVCLAKRGACQRPDYHAWHDFHQRTGIGQPTCPVLL